MPQKYPSYSAIAVINACLALLTGTIAGFFVVRTINLRQSAVAETVQQNKNMGMNLLLLFIAAARLDQDLAGQEEQTIVSLCRSAGFNEDSITAIAGIITTSRTEKIDTDILTHNLSLVTPALNAQALAHALYYLVSADGKVTAREDNFIKDVITGLTPPKKR